MAATDNQMFVNLIFRGYEERNLEYKRSISWNDSLTKLRIAKSILAMSNIRDGGYIIIGIEEEDGHFIPTGMNEDDLVTFNSDDIADFVSTCADPYVRFSLHNIEFEDKKFLVLQVEEFEKIPVICKKDYGNILHKGVIYTRSRRKPESIAIPSQNEMREILDIAIEKGIKEYIERSLRVGTTLTKPSDKEQFNRQLEEFR